MAIMIIPMTVKHNIYIHVPFCISKCKYCAFFSTANTSPDWETYLSEIISEINYWGEKLGHCDIPTIFFGGGTPSLMPVDIFSKIINQITKQFHVLPDCEITIESNPGTIDNKKLADFIGAGITRLSVGVQSLDDETLKFMGRRHDVKTALILLETAQKHNINLNADFIYGLPHQTTDDIIKMCEQINSLGLNHVSMYELTIEPTTPFGKMNLELPSNDTMAEMYIAINQNLNLPRYEVSNYAKHGYECKHNQNIWDGDAYIGIGRGAAGRIHIDNIWYEQMGANQKFEKIDNKTRAIECVITGLRTKRGVLLTQNVRDIISMDFVKQNPYLISIENNRLFLTDNGILMLDNLLLNLVK